MNLRLCVTKVTFCFAIVTLFLSQLSIGNSQEAPARPRRASVPDVPASRKTSESWMSLDDWKARHQKNLDRKTEAPIRILFMGDSITQGWGNNAVWQEHYKNRDAANFGIGGDTTQELLWRITEGGELDGISPKVIVLLIGTNNSGLPAEDIARGITKVVTTTREKLPDSKILLLAVFPRGKTAEDRVRPKLAQVNEIVSKLDDGKNIRYLDIGKSLVESDGSFSAEVSRDNLHLLEPGYRRWADAMNPLLFEMLGENK